MKHNETERIASTQQESDSPGPTIKDSSDSSIQELRQREYRRLDDLGHVYVDYTGGSLYGTSQIARFQEMLADGVFGNPHSINPSSAAATELVDRARADVLRFFNASLEDYDAIFTPNASGALRLVGESFPFGPGSRYVATFDNHNSVNGIREFARRGGADVIYAPLTLPDMRIDQERLDLLLTPVDTANPSLFAFPAQSNFSGVQHDLGLIAKAQERGWKVLLDAAAFVPTNRLDLSMVKPDFVPISFYKMFGFPTGIGALLVRKSALAELQRPWFGGGTISLVSVQNADWHSLLPGHAGFEDGTVNYLMIPAVSHGLAYLESVGRDSIHDRVQALTGWSLRQWLALQHENGQPLIRVYGPTDLDRRGSTIAFSVLDPDGTPYHYHHVETLAANQGISLRTGCFCNPGAGETAHHLTEAEMSNFFDGHQWTFDRFYEQLGSVGKHPSTIRVSFGIASNEADAASVTTFLKSFANRTPTEIAAAAAPNQTSRAARPDGS